MSGAGCTKRSCTASTTPACSTSPASSSTPPTSGLKKGRTHRSEPRGPGQAGFQDARPVGRERTAPTRRPLRGQHPRQPRPEAHDRRVTKRDTTPTAAATSSPSASTPTRPTTSLTCGNGYGASTSECASPARDRVQRTLRAPQMGHRTHHVLAHRLPQTQPPLRTPSPQLPGLPRPRRSPLLLQTTRPTHHIGHGLRARSLAPFARSSAQPEAPSSGRWSRKYCESSHSSFTKSGRVRRAAPTCCERNRTPRSVRESESSGV